MDDTINAMSDRLDTCINNVHLALHEIFTTQQASQHNRFQDGNNQLTNSPQDTYHRKFSALNAIRNFFRQSETQNKPFYLIFEDQYGVSLEELSCISNKNDSIGFWNNFQSDLRCENSPERYILSFVTLVTLATLLDKQNSSEKVKEFSYEDNKRIFNIFFNFYNDEVMHHEKTLPETNKSMRISDSDKRTSVIQTSIPLNPLAYQNTSHMIFIPEIFIAFGDYMNAKNKFSNPRPTLSNRGFSSKCLGSSQ